MVCDAACFFPRLNHRDALRWEDGIEGIWRRLLCNTVVGVALPAVDGPLASLVS